MSLSESKSIVSIIVPTKNSARTLTACLQSIKTQTYPNIEVVIVDDFSYDNTKAIAEKFRANFISQKAGMSLARNIGIADSKGSFILSMDSDMELSPKVIEECVKKADEGFNALIIPEVSVGAGFWAECVALEKKCYVGDDLIEASRFFRKSAVERLGGYDSNLEAGEDWDFNIRVKKAGYKTGRINAFIKHHEGQLKFLPMVRKKYKYGKSLKRYESKHPSEAKQQFNILRPAIVKNWKILLRYPQHFLGLILLKGCEFAAIKLGALATDLRVVKNTVPEKKITLTAQIPERTDWSMAPSPYALDSPATELSFELNLHPHGAKPLVSIIIPAKDSADTIEACLRSILAQTYDNLEVIVVDNFSNDQTQDIAANLGARVYSKGFERCTQVNFGVSKAKGKYVYRVDSDFILEPNVVKEAVEICEKNGYDAVAVHNTSDASISFWAKVRKMERDTYRKDYDHIGARFWRKNAFESVGGFDAELVAGDDYDLQNRLVASGYKIGRINAQETHIGEPKSLTEIFRKHYYYGQSIQRFIRKNKKRALVQLSPLRLNPIRGFSKEPSLAVGFLVYQFLRYTAAGLGMLSILFKDTDAN